MDLVPSIPITLDRPRTLRFDMNAMIAAQRATGRSFYESLQPLLALKDELGKLDPKADPESLASTALGVMAKIPVADIRALLWAGLLHEDPAITETQVGAMLGPVSMMPALTALATAFSEQGPEPTTAANANPTEPSPAT